MAAGDPFKCPECGCLDFRVGGMVFETQRALVFDDGEGKPDPLTIEYMGCVEHGDAGEDDEVACTECDYVFEFAKPPTVCDELLRLHESLFPERYDEAEPMYVWDGDTLPNLVSMIEGMLRDNGDTRARLEPRNQWVDCTATVEKKHVWGLGRNAEVYCRACGRPQSRLALSNADAVDE